TNGVFKIKHIQLIGNSSEAEVYELLLALEQHSSHPIAKSIVEELKSITITKKYTSIVEEKGLGIHAVDTANNSYKIGSYRYAEHLTKDSKHNLYVLKNELLIAVVDLEDTIKENVDVVINSLKQQTITPILLSGDSEAKCNEVAQKVGITKVYSQQLPHQKLEIIEQMSKNGSTAMVGDGINDAPALAKATVGISLSNATQAAIQSAQIILLKNNDLSSLTQAHLISKHTLLTIKQNLFWAFFYNVVAIPIAAAGLLSPMVGALSMAFSDVIVIGNSIRLKTKKLV
ncbi:MAG: HAD-IC family P-type ATPase, partial [Bacteroidia bacterium]